MKNKGVVEKHITVDESYHNMLRALAEKQRRTMRAVVSLLIKEAFEKDK